jgi:hypothetical protein
MSMSAGARSSVAPRVGGPERALVGGLNEEMFESQEFQ